MFRGSALLRQVDLNDGIIEARPSHKQQDFSVEVP